MNLPEPGAPDELPNYVADPLARQDPQKLEAARDYINDLLAHYEALEAREIDDDVLADVDEELLDVQEDEDDALGGTTVVKKVPCGKDCDGCPHGPYEYRVHREGEKLVWDYVGPVAPT